MTKWTYLNFAIVLFDWVKNVFVRKEVFNAHCVGLFPSFLSLMLILLKSLFFFLMQCENNAKRGESTQLHIYFFDIFEESSENMASLTEDNYATN